MKGDHVCVNRGLYWHHGIDLGDGRVVHYSGEPGNVEDAAVVISTLETFLKGGALEPVRHRRAFDPEVVAIRALSRVGEKKYNLASNNCETFATWCTTGEAVSQQVLNVMKAAGRWILKMAGR